jgi:5-(carboxyamino)imidazole ribonucleotide mutase
MGRAARTLEDFSVPYEARVVSAHRTPHLLYDYATSAAERGLRCIIAGAGGAAHLPGMTAALTLLPVLAVPVKSSTLQGVDSLLSIVQMPAGIPTATFAIGDAGAINAALFAVAMLSLDQPDLAQRLTEYRTSLRQKVEAMELPPLPKPE